MTMELYVRVTILPIWRTGISGTREMRARGKLRADFNELAEKIEKKIKQGVMRNVNPKV